MLIELILITITVVGMGAILGLSSAIQYNREYDYMNSTVNRMVDTVNGMIHIKHSKELIVLNEMNGLQVIFNYGMFKSKHICYIIGDEQQDEIRFQMLVRFVEQCIETLEEGELKC